VVQPHRYSRTADLFERFARAFDGADAVFVTDVYAAGEAPIDGIDGKALARALALHHPGTVTYAPKDAALPDVVARAVKAGDVVLTLGAGDITRVAPELVRWLSAA